MQVPIFPLNSVVFPGTVTPLHIFEDRYRALVRDLLRVPEERERVFGIVAIREGYEVGEHGVSAVHRVGTLVQLTEAERLPDGRFEISVTGRRRLRLRTLKVEGEYAVGEVGLEDEFQTGFAPTPEEQAAATQALAVFERYRQQLGQVRGAQVEVSSLPDDPAWLSWTLAATCPLGMSDRQRLLEVPTAAERLGKIARALRRETLAMRALPSLPATATAHTRWSAN